MIWLGIIIGMVIGAPLGFLIACLASVSGTKDEIVEQKSSEKKDNK